MKRFEVLLCFALISCVLFGCTESSPPTASQGVQTEVVDPDSGVVIRTHTDETQIRIADRLVVSVEVEWDSPVSIEIIEPDWSLEGWERIDASAEPIEKTPNGYISASSYLIEPFLSGDYIIPPISVEISPSKDAQSYSLSSMPIEVAVRGVLNKEDSGELAQVGGYIAPSLSNDQSADLNTVIPLLIGAALAIVGLIVWRMAKSADDVNTHLNAYEIFEEVARGTAHTQTQAYRRLYLAFSLLDPRLQRTSEINGLIQECERARFSHGITQTLTAQAMAQHTLELLGVRKGEEQ